MAKKVKEINMNLYYMHHGQDEQMKKKKAKEREKRIRENKGRKKDEFDIDTEAVIQMTNKNKIKKEQEHRKKIKQEEIKRKRRNKKKKLMLKTVLLLSIIIGGIAFALISPIFDIKEIQVIHNEQISVETIISLSQIEEGENIFQFNIAEAIHKIKDNAYIEKVNIHRKIPNTIQIEIEERTHDYSVDFMGKYAYINKQGYILSIAEESKEKMIIQGIETPEEQVIVGQRLNQKDLAKLEDVIKIKKAAKEYNLEEKITSMDIKNQSEYTLFLEEENKKVYLGNNSNLSNKMLYVNAIIEEEKGKKGTIFANGDLNHKFKVYFRESLDV